MRHTRRRRSGFTLLEVLLVLIILGLLAGLVAPAIFGMRDNANIDAARAQINLFHSACDNYRLHMNNYPQSLNELVENSANSTKWRGPYLDKIPNDPWEKPFVFEFQTGTQKPLIFSNGPDMVAKTEDDIHREVQQQK